MEYLYKCEKCGKIFDSYDEASNCEDSHLDIDLRDWSEDLHKNTAVYHEGDVIPHEIVLKSYGELDGEKSVYFGLYRRVSMLSADIIEMIGKEHNDRIEKSRLWWEKYKAEQEAKKAAEAEKEQEQ